MRTFIGRGSKTGFDPKLPFRVAHLRAKCSLLLRRQRCNSSDLHSDARSGAASRALLNLLWTGWGSSKGLQPDLLLLAEETDRRHHHKPTICLSMPNMGSPPE
jgi:hypothetical protein